MTDTTMITKLRQAQAAVLAMAEALDVPTHSMLDMIEIGISGGQWWVHIVSIEDETITGGKTLEEAYLKMKGDEVPF